MPAVELGITAGFLIWRGLQWLDARDRPPLPKPRPKDIEFPQLGAGTTLPYVAGTVRVDAPVLAWWGNSEAIEVTGADGVYTYGADLIYVVGIPPWDAAAAPYNNWRTTNPPKLLSFWVGDKKFTIGGGGIEHGEEVDVAGTSADGEEFLGRMQFFDGRQGQTLSGLALAVLAAAGVNSTVIPGFAHQMLVVISSSTSSGTFGYSARLPGFSFEVQALGPDPIGMDANPAWVAYDLIARPMWGVGIDSSDMDLTSFTNVAATLVTEEHGISIQVTQPEEATKILTDIAAHADLMFFENPATSCITCVAMRQDYTLASLPEATQSRFVGTRPKVTAIGWNQVATQVDIKFTNRTNDYRPDTVAAPRLGNSAAASFRRMPRELAFPGCCTPALASTIAARETATLSRPIMTIQGRLRRDFYATLPGDVLNVSLPGYNITGKAFRVLQVDLGQLADGAIGVMLVEDVFGQTAGGFDVVIGELLFPYLLPIHERLLTEAPYWIMQKMYEYGVITSPDVQRLYAVAVNDDDAATTNWKATSLNSTLGEVSYTADVPGGNRLTHYASVSTAYPRTAEPYDTTTGLVIGSPSADLVAILDALTTPTETQIRQGLRLAILMHADGAHEFVAFEGVTGASGGPYTLTNVWRGLMDTPPIDHAAGTRFVWLGDRYATPAGVRGWSEGTDVSVQFVPRGSILTGSGDDAVDTLTIAGRGANPLPVSDLAIAGNDLDGTEGTPATSGYYKAVSLFDGDGVLDAAQRNRLGTTLERGDDPASVVESGTTWDVVAERQNLDEDPDGEVTLQSGLTTTGLANFTLGTVGVGTIDVKMRSQRAGRASTYDPAVRVTAPSWRNLLANSRLYSIPLAELATTGWTNSIGTIGVGQDSNSLQRTAAGTYMISATASAGVTTCYQNVQLSGFPVSRMAAQLHFYYRNLSADADDTVTVQIQPIDATGSLLDVATSSGALTGSATLWTRSVLTIASVPSTATGVRVTITMTAAGGGDTAPSSAVAGLVLNAGQISSQLISNPTFDEPTATLTYAVSGSPDPVATSTTTTWTVTPTVGGENQTSLSVTIRLIYPGTKGASPTDTLNGWSNTGGWTSISDSTWEATFTRASATVGTPTFSFTATSGSTTGTLTADITAGSSAEVASAGLTDDTVAVASLAITAVWDDADNSIVEDVATTFTVTHTPTNFTPTTATILVTISTGSTTSSPTTVSNPDSWTIGSWSNPGGGTQWTATLSKAGAPPAGTSSIQFSTTPSTAGSLGLAASGSNPQNVQGSSGTDTLTVTAAISTPTYIGAGAVGNGTGDVTPGMPTHQADDILILSVCNGHSITTDAATPSGWTKITGINSGSYGGLRAHLTLFYKRATSGSESAPTVTDNGETNAARVYCFRGCTTSGSPVDVSSTSADNDGDLSLSIAGATTSGADRLIGVFVSAFIGGSSSASLASWANSDLTTLTERDDTTYNNATNQIHQALLTGEKSTAGAYGATTASWGGSPPYVVTAGITIALKP